MKRYKIRHQTTYNFFSQVQLLPHSLRLRPREGHELRIVSSELKIYPDASLSWQRDVEGNSVAFASFAGYTKRLHIDSEILIEKYDLLPFDFLVEDYAVHFPFDYRDDDRCSLSPYLMFQNMVEFQGLKTWVDGFRVDEKPVQTFSLLFQINQYIHHNFSYLMREEEGVQSPDKTLALGSGSCRDFAYLLLVAAQQLGLASRFVSGYVYSGYSADWCGSTHAWTEVFIPGAGWKGFDPTSGTLVGAEHISVAVARSPDLVPPVSGNFYGDPGSTMTVSVSVLETD